MGCDWATRPLKDCAIWYSGGTPSKSRSDFWGGDIPWISAKSLNDFFICDSEDKVTETGAQNGTRLVPENTILFIVRGMSLKTEFRMGITTRPVTFNQDLKALAPHDDIVPSFLAYAIRARTPEILGLVGEAGHGTGVLPTDRIQALQIPVPPLKEQQAIAHILGTLDDKIELNRKMNQTLEEMVRAIFKSWFVDFDPVRRKAEGKKPIGMDFATAALFPDSFEDSALGEIPRGWKAGVIEDVAICQRRGVSPGDIDPATPYIGLEHMPRRHIGLADWESAQKVTSNKAAFKKNEILFGKLRPYFHKVGIAPLDGVCSTDIVVVAGKAPPWSGFVLQHLSSVEFVNYVDASSTGTKMPRTNWTDMAAYEIAIPNAALAARYAELISQPATDKLVSNIFESKGLGELRDTLLPKLLSGELRIKDAEKIVGVAV